MEYPMLKSIVNKFNNEYEQDVVMNPTPIGWVFLKKGVK